MATYNGRYIPDFLRILGVVHERDDYKAYESIKEFYKKENEALNKLNKNGGKENSLIIVLGK